MSRFTLLSGVQRVHWREVSAKVFKGVGVVFLGILVSISDPAHATQNPQPTSKSNPNPSTYLSNPQLPNLKLKAPQEVDPELPVAVIMIEGQDKQPRYWLRSPVTHGQWIAVRDFSPYVKGKLDLFAVLKPDGWMLFERQANGNHQLRRFPAAKGLTALPGPIPVAVTNVAISESRDYRYDANGNLLTRLSPSRLDQYTYDALDRLKEDAPWDQVPRAHTYDANGNRTDRGSITYQSNNNRIAMVNGIALSYDPSGNLKTDHRGKTYSYNSTGRLASITAGGQTLATYSYNAQGLRTKKVTPQGTIRYHYDLQGNLLTETTETGEPLRTYIWLDGTPVAQIDHTPTGEKITYLHTDHLNTPRVGTDENGKVTWRWESDSFGFIQPHEDPDNDGITTTVNLRFPGQYYDKESGLHYNWQRYYDPELGRYITSDPIGLEGGLNTYAYVGSNPLYWIDPDGLGKGRPRPSNNNSFQPRNPWESHWPKLGEVVPRHSEPTPQSPLRPKSDRVLNRINESLRDRATTESLLEEMGQQAPDHRTEPPLWDSEWLFELNLPPAGGCPVPERSYVN